MKKKWVFFYDNELLTTEDQVRLEIQKKITMIFWGIWIFVVSVFNTLIIFL